MATLQVEGETLRATGGHPFWVVRGEGLADRPKPVRIGRYEPAGRQQGRWVLARDLRAGDRVLLRQGEVVMLESVRLDDVDERVYNFHVAELQNSAVGRCGVLVHNTNDPSTPRGGDGANLLGAQTGAANARVAELRSAIDSNRTRLQQLQQQLNEASQVPPFMRTPAQRTDIEYLSREIQKAEEHIQWLSNRLGGAGTPSSTN